MRVKHATMNYFNSITYSWLAVHKQLHSHDLSHVKKQHQCAIKLCFISYELVDIHGDMSFAEELLLSLLVVIKKIASLKYKMSLVNLHFIINY